MRVGIGYDLHRLTDGGPLRLGGIDIPFERGLQGHSDGDVLLHALADAILGAAALGDIGERFPDTDPSNKGLDSGAIVAAAVAEAAGLGLAIGNVDAVIHAEAPRLAQHREAIRASLGRLLGVEVDRVGLKGKTAEGLGEVGRGEAIGAQVIVLLKEAP